MKKSGLYTGAAIAVSLGVVIVLYRWTGWKGVVLVSVGSVVAGVFQYLSFVHKLLKD